MVHSITLKRAVIGLAASATLMVAGTAAAASHSGPGTPGWGAALAARVHSHIHSGPGGGSVVVNNTATTTVNNNQNVTSGDANGSNSHSGNVSNSANISASADAGNSGE